MKTSPRLLLPGFVVCAIALCDAAHAGCQTQAPFSVPLRRVHIQAAPLVDEVISAAILANVCLGIEGDLAGDLDGNLLTAGPALQFDQTTLAAVLQKILLEARRVQAVEQNGVVILRRKETPPARWLGWTVPVFNSARAPLQDVNNLLSMTFTASADPAIRGFLGTYNPGDQSDLIGPIHEERKSLLELLNQLVTSSKGSMWIVYGSAARDAAVPRKPFWRIFQYADERNFLLEQVRMLLTVGK